MFSRSLFAHTNCRTSTAKTMLHFEFKVFSVSNDEFFSLQCPCNIEKDSPWFPIPAFSDSGWESWGPCCLLSQTMLLGRIGSDFFHKVPHLGERHFRSCPCILAMLGAHGGNRFSSRVYCAELFPKVWKPCAYSCVNSGPVITTIVPLSILYLSIQCLHKINYWEINQTFKFALFTGQNSGAWRLRRLERLGPRI